jgi:hypothetical protein
MHFSELVESAGNGVLKFKIVDSQQRIYIESPDII